MEGGPLICVVSVDGSFVAPFSQFLYDSQPTMPRERERQRQRQRQTERDRERERQRDRERDRERGREGEPNLPFSSWKLCDKFCVS